MHHKPALLDRARKLDPKTIVGVPSAPEIARGCVTFRVPPDRSSLLRRLISPISHGKYLIPRMFNQLGLDQLLKGRFPPSP